MWFCSLILALMCTAAPVFAISCPRQLVLDFSDETYQPGEDHSLRLIREVLNPLVGPRLQNISPTVPRPIARTPYTCSFNGDLVEPKLKLFWEAGRDTPELEYLADENRLALDPALLGESHRDELEALVLKWMMGSSLHPYDNSEPTKAVKKEFKQQPRKMRKAQQECTSAAIASMNRGDRKHLTIGPPSLGKTEILLGVLEHRLQQESSQKLHIVTTDSADLIDQLAVDLETLQTRGLCEIVQWGGKFSPGDWAELQKRIDASPVPIVLVSTLTSLRLGLLAGPTPPFAALRERLATLAYDEVHHSGSVTAQLLVEELVDHADSRSFFYGTTATPTHRAVSIQALFGRNAFWAYLDTVEGYLKEKGRLERPLTAVLEQIFRAIDAGDLPLVDAISMLDPTDLAPAGDFFVPTASGKKHLNPAHFPALFTRLAPLIARNESGYFSVGSVDEANELQESLSKQFPGRKFAVYHTKMPGSDQKKIRERFRKSDKYQPGHNPEDKIDFLITIRKLDEGLNFPQMSLFVDLNASFTPRQFLQRLGRLLRLYPGKRGVDIFCLMMVDETKLGEKLALLDNIIKHTQRPPKGVEIKKRTIDLPENPGFNAITEADQIRALESLREKTFLFWKRDRAKLLAKWHFGRFNRVEFEAEIRRLAPHAEHDTDAAQQLEQLISSGVMPIIESALGDELPNLEETINDISQEVQLFCWENYREHGSLPSLNSIAQRAREEAQAYMHTFAASPGETDDVWELARAREMRRALGALASGEPTPAEVFRDRAVNWVLRSALRVIPPRQAYSVADSFELPDLDHPEKRPVMSTSHASARSRVANGLRYLHALLNDDSAFPMHFSIPRMKRRGWPLLLDVLPTGPYTKLKPGSWPLKYGPGLSTIEIDHRALSRLGATEPIYDEDSGYNPLMSYLSLRPRHRDTRSLRQLAQTISPYAPGDLSRGIYWTALDVLATNGADEEQETVALWLKSAPLLYRLTYFRDPETLSTFLKEIDCPQGNDETSVHRRRSLLGRSLRDLGLGPIYHPLIESGATLMHLAAQYNHTELLDWLLTTASVNPAVVDDTGKTPLDYARARGPSTVVHFRTDRCGEGKNAQAVLENANATTEALPRTTDALDHAIESVAFAVAARKPITNSQTRAEFIGRLDEVRAIDHSTRQREIVVLREQLWKFLRSETRHKMDVYQSVLRTLTHLEIAHPTSESGRSSSLFALRYSRSRFLEWALGVLSEKKLKFNVQTSDSPEIPEWTKELLRTIKAIATLTPPSAVLPELTKRALLGLKYATPEFFSGSPNRKFGMESGLDVLELYFSLAKTYGQKGDTPGGLWGPRLHTRLTIHKEHPLYERCKQMRAELENSRHW